MALLTTVMDAPPPSREFVRRCLGLLAEQGFQKVVTGALSLEEQSGFLDAGFTVHEQLHLLLRDRSVPLPPFPAGPALRRAWWWRAGRALQVDAAAFSPFWRLDKVGLKEALAATPLRRFRVAMSRKRAVLGYSICGAAGGRGFVQRLAVAPEAQGRGVGKRLLLDGLAWLCDAGALQVAVNTQIGNDAALHLYLSVGFREDPRGLCVLSADLNEVSVA